MRGVLNIYMHTFMFIYYKNVFTFSITFNVLGQHLSDVYKKTYSPLVSLN